jgi:NAD-dependent SIR2 family protein deacetylase
MALEAVESDDVSPPEIPADDFVRRYTMRPGQLMWFLGAGASAAAGIPTAGDMIWEFKQRLYATQKRVSPKSVENLASPAIRNRLQAFIDSAGSFPTEGSPAEYAALFEAVYPSEIDRQTYIRAKLGGAKPSYGHLALATFMKAGLTKVVWTTNFDTLNADACAKAYDSTGALTIADLGDPEKAIQSIAAGQFPLEVKLHGDFRSRRLKNTSDELREQDQRLRQVLVDGCSRYGLVVAGYSGRDSSVMEALEQALAAERPFPSGLFWLHRGDQEPLAAVIDLLRRARLKGVDAALVRIESFDEITRDIARLQTGLDQTLLDAFAAERQVWSPAPIPQGRPGFPCIRLNAIRIIESPAVCRRIVADVGGYSEIRDLVGRTQANIAFARIRAGVLAYGADEEVKKALAEATISDFSLHSIEERRLRYNSAERGLLMDVLARALCRERGLESARRRRRFVLWPAEPDSQQWNPLRQMLGGLSGSLSVKNEMIGWSEAIEIRLDWAADSLWLLFDPVTYFPELSEHAKGAAADFSRERTARRYNRAVNDVISFWAKTLSGNQTRLSAFGLTVGVDATFALGGEAALSQRVSP